MNPPCSAEPWLFDSTERADHERARAYCLGDDEYPPCPLLAACRAAYEEACVVGRVSGTPEGTWAGELHGAPKRGVREHGTDRGYGQHRHHGETACTPCRLAHNAATKAGYDRRKAEGRGRYERASA